MTMTKIQNDYIEIEAKHQKQKEEMNEDDKKHITNFRLSAEGKLNI